MAPRRVIEDSDEDEASILEELSSLSEAANEVSSVQMLRPSSTDPVLFRAVYEQHLGQLPIDEQLPVHRQYLVFEDPTIEQRMSSSASAPSTRKLTRSKTISGSSISSITEPTLSHRKAKRTESMRDIDELTQITTPRRSKDVTRKDPWEVPTSSASDQPFDPNSNLKSRNTEPHAARSISIDQRLSSPLEDDVYRILDQNKPVQNNEIKDSPMLRPKQHKIRSSVIVESPELGQIEHLDSTPKEGFPESIDVTSSRSVPVEIPRNASIYTNTTTNQTVVAYTHVSSSLSLPTQTNQVSLVEDSYLVTKSSTVPGSRKPPSSMVIVPDILSDEQKLQYEVVSVASTAESRRSSVPTIHDTIDSKNQHAKDSNRAHGDYFLSILPSDTAKSARSELSLSPSPPAVAMDGRRKRKRAHSEVAPTQILSSTTASYREKSAARKGRSKTIAQGEKPPCREGSVDELSLAWQQPYEKESARGRSTRTGGKRIRSEDEDELTTSTDKVHVFKETDHSRRATVKSADNLDIKTVPAIPAPPKKRGRKKTSDPAAAKSNSMSQPANSLPATTSEDIGTQPKAVRDVDDNRQPSDENESVIVPPKVSIESVPTSPPAPTAQTPTKNPKKGVDQHSPLQSGKVPYRVGLSKRTRIAPLLKMIRK